MGRVRGRDTKPELRIRSLLHRMGYRFRVNRRDLPGTPDIVVPRHHKIFFVHGCFWHGHKRCARSKRPTTNESFWNTKLDRNIDRDRRLQRKLRGMGWKVMVVWECQTGQPERLVTKLQRFLRDT